MNTDYQDEAPLYTSQIQNTIEIQLDKKQKTRKYLRVNLIMIDCLFILILLFYFFLPSYQCKNIKVINPIHFTTKEIAVLSENNTYRPLIFLEPEKSVEKLLKNSNGFIADAKYTSNGFSSSVVTREDYPLICVDNTVYFGSDRTLAQALNDLDSLPIDTETIARLKAEFQEDASKLPMLYIDGVNSINESQRKIALNALWGIHPDVLGITYAVKFSDNACKVADFILEYQEKYFVLQNLLYDLFDKYFDLKNFPQKVLYGMVNYAKEHPEEISDYQLDKDTTISAHKFIARYNDSTGEVTIAADRGE